MLCLRSCPAGSVEPAPPGSECPMGWYCNPSTSMTQCNAGTYGILVAGTSQAQACTACTAGECFVYDAYYWHYLFYLFGLLSSTLYYVGYYCLAGGTEGDMELCPAGSYCPSGSTNPTQCSAGLYNPAPGATSSTDCLTCPAGFYCPTGSADANNACPSGVCAHSPCGSHLTCFAVM